MPLILDNIWHRYDDTDWILRGISLKVSPGQSTALVGPSGSGKTTVLNLAAGLMNPVKGNVTRQAVERKGYVRSTADTAFVFQAMNALERRSVLDNVAVALVGLGQRYDDARFSATRSLNGVGLSHRLRESARTLSGGERQRMCVARALIVQPTFLFADEPTGQLDATNTAMVIEALLAGTNSGTAVLIATHDLSIAERCDTVVALDSGKVQ